MGVIVNIMQVASVRRIIEDAEKQIEAETGAPVKLSILMNRNDIVDIDFMIRLTCSMCAVTKEQLTGTSRQRIISDARKIFVMISRDFLECSWSEIGRVLGNRDHTTIMVLYNAGCNMLHTHDAMFLPKYSFVKESLINHIQRLKDESKAE